MSRASELIESLNFTKFLADIEKEAKKAGFEIDKGRTKGKEQHPYLQVYGEDDNGEYSLTVSLLGPMGQTITVDKEYSDASSDRNSEYKEFSITDSVKALAFAKGLLI